MTQTIEQLTARVAELEEENKNLLAANRDCLDHFNAMQKDLAIAEEHNARIREKLLPYPKLAHNTGFFYLQEFFEEILSLPASREALDKYVAEKVREAGKFDIWRTNPYTKVLETSIKQLTKQRDLAVEALEKIAKKCNLDMHGDDGSLGGYAYGIWNTANSTLSIIKESDAGT